MENTPELNFRIAPHAIEDLGSNLYTNFAKVLAEFVANAYDADATKVSIFFDFKKVDDARKLMRKAHLREVEDSPESQQVLPLDSKTLPETIAVEIRDNGFGMSPQDLNDRFLWTARKRRTLPAVERTKSRLLMGRKGLGKLAGFGVARVLEVVTKRANDDMGVRFRLDYDEILKHEDLSKIQVVSEWDRTEFGVNESGTVIYLKRLGFDAVKSQKQTVVREIAEHFEFVDGTDFRIELNEHRIPTPKPNLAFAWPDSEESLTHLVDHTLETEMGDVQFRWRIRFREDRKALPAQKRGVRIYTHNRLASAPSMFDADTNMHGFRMTDYMDGVVVADFIDDQTQDYVSTNRQSLRWETPLLSPLREFISEQIKEACKRYQAVRDKAKKEEVGTDRFTTETIDAGGLSSREKSLVKSVAVRLARISKKGVSDPSYKEVLPQIVRAIGHGELYNRLSELAEMSSPDLDSLLAEIVRLNRSELDGSTHIVRSRLKAIESLEKEVRRDPRGGGPRNERTIQKLFEEAPWLMDPSFKDYLTADKSLHTTLKLLAKELGIVDAESHPHSIGSENREPDFFFVMSNHSFSQVLIVELKATTKPAEIDDIMQLREYMDTAKQWLGQNSYSNVSVRGELICTPPDRKSGKRDHRRFWIEADKLTPWSDHRVRPYLIVLDDTKKAHDHILAVVEKFSAEST